MTIYTLGFAVMLLALEVYSSSQSAEKKIPMWKAVILSLGWPLCLIAFLGYFLFSGLSVSKIAKKVIALVKKPIG